MLQIIATMNKIKNLSKTFARSYQSVLNYMPWKKGTYQVYPRLDLFGPDLVDFGGTQPGSHQVGGVVPNLVCHFGSEASGHQERLAPLQTHMGGHYAAEHDAGTSQGFSLHTRYHLKQSNPLYQFAITII